MLINGNSVSDIIYNGNSKKLNMNGWTENAKVGTRDYLVKFALLSDVHISDVIWSDYSLIDNIMNFINAQNTDFTIVTGDVIDSGYLTTPTLMASQLATYYAKARLLNKNIYPLKGNHDEDVIGFSKNSVIDFNGVRLIHIWADYVGLAIPNGQAGSVWSTGVISSDTLTWLEARLKESGFTQKILMCHYPIAIDNTYANFKWWIQDSFTDINSVAHNGNRTALLALTSAYGVKLFINGHEHNASYPTSLVGNMTDINGGSTTTKFSICTIKSTQATFDIYNTLGLAFDKTVTVPLV